MQLCQLVDRLTRVTAGVGTNGGNNVVRKLGEPWKYPRPHERAARTGKRIPGRALALKFLGR